MSSKGWIGVDLDGTLAEYSGWMGPNHVGAPIEAMVNRVKDWLSADVDVRIFTARATIPEQIPAVKRWCLDHIGVELPVTNVKDFHMIELWDDRCVQVEANTGRRMDGKS